MKCIEIEKNIDLLLDDEANLLQKQEIKTHLEICDSCQTKFEALQKTKALLKEQPAILPSNSFDNRMLQAFENKLNAKPTPKENWFAKFFAIPKPAFALMLALFAIGVGLAFLFGRMSVSSPQPIISNVAKNTEKEAKPNEKMVEISPPEKIVNQTKFITKYVEIPVVKEKVIEKIVYVNEPINIKPKTNKEDLVNETNKKERENIVNQVSLKDLQPVANVTYKIIRRGENNE